MTAVVIPLPRTPAGRAELRDALKLSSNADFRVYLATEFDWDESAVEMVRMGLADYSAYALQPRKVG